MLTSRAGRDRRGFSLLELLVVLLLLAVSASLVLPSIERGLKAREVRQSALGLAALARDLRSRAIHEGALQYLLLNPSENSYEVAGGKKILLPSDVRMTAVQGGEPSAEGMRRFLFFPNGSTLGGEVALSGPEGLSYTVRLDPLLGKVEVLRGNVQ